MFGFRFFWTLGMALCLCASHWGQAHAANAAASDVQLVAAANVKLEKAKTGQSGNKASQAHTSAKAGKQTKNSKTSAKIQAGKGDGAKAATSSPKEKSAAKSAMLSPHNKSSHHASAKHRKFGPLEPASAELPQSGIASWVGRSFHGKPVAISGEVHLMESFTAAHRAIAFHSILKVTDMRNGRSVLVRVNDRGPYIRGRIIDLAKAAAEYLGYADRGITTVRLEFAGNDKDPAQRYYIRMWPAKDPGKAGPVRGFGPFNKFDEAVSLFASLYQSYPNAELLAVREDG